MRFLVQIRENLGLLVTTNFFVLLFSLIVVVNRPSKCALNVFVLYFGATGNVREIISLRQTPTLTLFFICLQSRNDDMAKLLTVSAENCNIYKECIMQDYVWKKESGDAYNFSLN